VSLTKTNQSLPNSTIHKAIFIILSQIPEIITINRRLEAIFILSLRAFHVEYAPFKTGRVGKRD